MRLARFNIQAGSVDKRYFVGMPSPAAATVPASTIFAYPSGFQEPIGAIPVLALVLVPAFLMVSTIKFRSFKTFDLQARRSLHGAAGHRVAHRVRLGASRARARHAVVRIHAVGVRRDGDGELAPWEGGEPRPAAPNVFAIRKNEDRGKTNREKRITRRVTRVLLLGLRTFHVLRCFAHCATR